MIKDSILNLNTSLNAAEIIAETLYENTAANLATQQLQLAELMSHLANIKFELIKINNFSVHDKELLSD